jgi:DNA-directed RNA polymerase specialized sigma24 family protein
MNDCELLQKIGCGDAKALEKLMDKYSRYVVAVIVHLAGEQLAYEDVEEICSDVFVKIWRCSSSIQLASDTLKPYLRRQQRI